MRASLTPSSSCRSARGDGGGSCGQPSPWLSCRHKDRNEVQGGPAASNPLPLSAQKTPAAIMHISKAAASHIAWASAPDSLMADRPFAAATLRRSPDATADRRPQEPSRRMPYSRKTSAMTLHASLSLVRKCTVCRRQNLAFTGAPPQYRSHEEPFQLRLSATRYRKYICGISTRCI